ncbi:MAG: replicative DNA helicase [Melioribacteraceae bacterium]|nr:replicative DNA helicase [Melioribacteraceae bacterium]
MQETVSNTNNIDMLRNSTNKPPAAVEVEFSVLGAMVLDNNAVPRVMEILRPECFFDKRHMMIFECITELFSKNEPIDTVSLYEELKRAGNIEAVGGAAFLSRLSQDISSAANIDYHSRIVLEKWILRELISTTMGIASSAYTGTEDVFDLLDDAEQKIFSITEQGLKESYKGMEKAVKEAIEHIEAIHSQDTSSFAVPSGIASLDEMMGGFQRTDLIILAARPAMGKTAFALSIARNAAVDHDIPIAIFSLEMATIQLVTRLICAEARINAHSVRTGKFKAEDGPRISRTAHKLSKAKIYVDDTPAQTVLEIRAKCRRLKMEKKIGMIIIDYLQLMDGSGRSESREREISNISRSLKALAKELNVPVIALSQLNRAVESRNDKVPMLSDLRESGSIEQDADVVMFLNRPEYYGIMTDAEGNSTEGLGEVIIAKQRNGPTGTVKARFIKEYARYENLDPFHDGISASAPKAPDIPFDGDLPI